MISKHRISYCTTCSHVGRSFTMYLLAAVLAELQDMRTANRKIKEQQALLLQGYEELLHSQILPVP